MLVRGTHLVRSADSNLFGLALTGDTGTDADVEVFTSARFVSWNGRFVATARTPSGSLTAKLPTAQPVSLPELTNWRTQAEWPQDDSTWPVATRTTTNSRTTPATLPVLFADDYDFRTGNTWYHGHFTATGKETGIGLTSQSGGPAGQVSVWLNGTFLGSAGDGRHDFTFPPGAIRTGDNTIAVLTVNMGHEEDYNASNGNKAARGLIGATLTGAPLTSVTWRLQGARTGLDPTRGPLNTGGLYGENAGWSLPGFPDRTWQPVALPANNPTPGVTWYRTTTRLDLPAGQDTSVGVEFTDSPQRNYRALLYVNGWQVGQYINNVGPQHSFPVPTGVLNPHGTNTIAIAVWNTDASTGGLGQVKLVTYGSYASSLHVNMNESPGYDPRRYATPRQGLVPRWSRRTSSPTASRSRCPPP
ncbi:hypothetical protein GCM10029964_066320 [Kibdelosporangium lantanae]